VPHHYQKIVHENLRRLFADPAVNLEKNLPAVREQNAFIFQAFGQECRLQPDGIRLEETDQNGILGILISLYALNASPWLCVTEPLKAYKDFRNSMPYAGAFVTHAQQPLVPHVSLIKAGKEKIIEKFKGEEASEAAGGDFSILVYPLPKIALCYVFYEADEDFAASATCLFSNNADVFMPIDGLADVGEYTAKTILDMIVAP
jgi:hypothetical protein